MIVGMSGVGMVRREALVLLLLLRFLQIHLGLALDRCESDVSLLELKLFFLT